MRQLRPSSSISGVWKQGRVQLLRHRRTKGPETARRHLNYCATRRLHLARAEICLRGVAIRGGWTAESVESCGLSGAVRCREVRERDCQHGSARTAGGRRVRRQRIGSTAVDGEGDGAEQVLKGPAGSQVEADTAGGLADAGADFEELSAESLDLSRAPRLRQLKAE
jgi:hypothetical protein